MKTKKLLSFAGLLIIVGLVMFMIGFASVGFDFYELDKTQYTATQLNSSNEIFDEGGTVERVNIDVSDFRIRVQSGDELKIDYFTTENSIVTTDYSVQGNIGELTFKYRESWKEELKLISGLKKSKLEFVITVPKNIQLNLAAPSAKLNLQQAEFTALNIKANSGKVEINNVKTPLLDFSGNSSDIIIRGSEIDTIKLSGNSSDFELENVTAKSIDISGSSSDTIIEKSTIQGAIVVEGNSAKFDLEHTSAKSFSGKGNSSKVEFDSCVFESVSFSGNSSKVTVDSFVDASSFEFEGNSNRYYIIIVGTLQDFAYITLDGNSSSLRVGDEKRSSFVGTGTKTFTVSGNSTTCKIRFSAAAH